MPATTSNHRWKQTALGRAVVYLGSVQFAVPLLTFVTFAMIWGTYIDTVRGAAAAGDAVYGSWWFILLMALVCVCLILSVATRWPWRMKHVGFIVVHASLVALIVSAFISYFTKVEGKIILREGQTASEILTNTWQIKMLDRVDGGWSLVDSALVDMSPSLTIGDEHFRIVEFWSNSKDALEVTDTGARPLHAIQIGFTPQQRRADWLGELRPDEQAPVVNGVVIHVLRAGEQWEAPGEGEEASSQMTLVVERIDGHPRALVVMPDGSTTTHEMHKQGPWRIPLGDKTAYIFNDYARANAMMARVKAPDSDSNSPTVVLDWVAGGASQRIVLPMGTPTSIMARAGERFLQYQPVPYSLPFAITLEDFRVMDYPGSEMAMAYESDVVLHVEDTQQKIKIWMNNPLEHDGWRLYQSGYVGDDMSILQATHDPGLTPMYISATTLCIGIILTFFVGPLGGGHPGIPAPFTASARKASHDDSQSKTAKTLEHASPAGDDGGNHRAGSGIGGDSPAVGTGDGRDPGGASGQDDADRHAGSSDGGRTHGPNEVVS